MSINPIQRSSSSHLSFENPMGLEGIPPLDQTGSPKKLDSPLSWTYPQPKERQLIPFIDIDECESFSSSNRNRHLVLQHQITPLPHAPSSPQTSSVLQQQRVVSPKISPTHQTSPKILSPHSPRNATTSKDMRQKYRRMKKMRSLATYFFSCLNCCIFTEKPQTTSKSIQEHLRN